MAKHALPFGNLMDESQFAVARRQYLAKRAESSGEFGGQGLWCGVVFQKVGSPP